MTIQTAGMYLHIPFCFSKCRYCSFVSVPVQGHYDQRIPLYVQRLILEMERRRDEWNDVRFDTLFIGGGTPSILPVPYIAQLIEKASALFLWDAKSEITVEVNPESFTPEKAFSFAKAGVNRLSFGVQSTSEEELTLLGRPHTWADAQNAIDYAHMAGIFNINVDLMYNLPGQSAHGFFCNVRNVLSLGVQHLSCYALTLEEGTPIFKAIERKELPRPEEDVAADSWEGLGGLAGRYGLKRYEISNYAKKGFESKHNLHYWHQDGYAGFGAAAHGAKRVDGAVLRTRNADSIDGYLSAGPQTVTEEISGRSLMFEYVMLHTRLTEGLWLTDFERRFGLGFLDVYAPAINKAVDMGLGVLTSERFFLNNRGMLLQNSVLQWFMD